MAIETRAPTMASAAGALGRAVVETTPTACCVVGGGPAGMVLGLLLARRGVDVTVIEQHEDFDRDFRGDTVHPSTVRIMDEIGLADRLMQLPHTKMHRMTFVSSHGPVTMADFGRLKTRFPFVMMLPQVRFLEFLADEAKRFPSFHLVMDAPVQELVREGGAVRGVRYRSSDGFHEVRADVVVAADGRFSKVRQLAGIEQVKTSPPMDVLWFRLPRRPDEGHGAMGHIAHKHMAVMLDRGDTWQVAYVIPKGSYKQLHEAGIEALRKGIVEILPFLADRVEQLTDWKQVALLSVESGRAKRWYEPGLLLIGDAAHVMSPVGGVGINYAVQDAVVAANVLTKPLLERRLTTQDLASVQRRREWPTRIIQGIQTAIQKQIVSGALSTEGELDIPLPMRWPIVRDIPARVMGFGVWPVHVRN